MEFNKPSEKFRALVEFMFVVYLALIQIQASNIPYDIDMQMHKIKKDYQHRCAVDMLN